MIFNLKLMWSVLDLSLSPDKDVTGLPYSSNFSNFPKYHPSNLPKNLYVYDIDNYMKYVIKNELNELIE